MDSFTPKFKKGDLVRIISEGKDFERREVIQFTFDSENGFIYQVTSKEINMKRKEFINGFMRVSEDEIAPIEQIEDGK